MAYAEWQEENPESLPSLVPSRNSKLGTSTPTRISLIPQKSMSVVTEHTQISEDGVESNSTPSTPNLSITVSCEGTLQESVSPTCTTSAGLESESNLPILSTTASATVQEDLASAANVPAVPPKSSIYGKACYENCHRNNLLIFALISKVQCEAESSFTHEATSKATI